jgi:NosR/NirI family nitrous oxide reductase transcriptional regulator
VNRKFKIILFLFVVCMSISTSAQVQERFPKPDFQTDYTRPDIHLTDARSQTLEYIDILVLFIFLSLASYFVIKQRSRRNIFLLTLASIGYFGFYREGCVCSVGSVQNVTLALFNSGYVIPVSVIIFFVLPLIFTIFFGRTFCSSVCPLGAIQDVVILKNTKISPKVSAVLSLLPYFYLGLALLFAANGAGFIICQYDPFIGFYRFGGTFNMMIFGASLLLLGTFVARPYCRFLCPYGVLLNWMSFLSKKHATITPDKCNNCRLCEASCPVDAIRIPEEIDTTSDKKRETKKIIVLFVLLPLIVAGSGWIVSTLNVHLSKQHFTVWLAEQIEMENNGEITVLGTETNAFRASGKSKEILFQEAAQIRDNFSYGGWFLGGLLSLILFVKLVNLSIKKKRPEYEIDKGSCVSCGKCFIYCPYEKVRLGILTPEEVDNY